MQEGKGPRLPSTSQWRPTPNARDLRQFGIADTLAHPLLRALPKVFWKVSGSSQYVKWRSSLGDNGLRAPP